MFAVSIRFSSLNSFSRVCGSPRSRALAFCSPLHSHSSGYLLPPDYQYTLITKSCLRAMQTEYELILVLEREQFFMLNFPSTDLAKINQCLSLSEVAYQPISKRLSLKYETKDEKNDQVAPTVEFDSSLINNRTYYTLAKLDEQAKCIYLYQVANFQQMRPRMVDSKAEQPELEVEQPNNQSQASQLLLQRNKLKMMEQQKQQFKWQQELKAKEERILLKPVASQVFSEVKQVKQPKLVAKTDYQKSFFQK